MSDRIWFGVSAGSALVWMFNIATNSLMTQDAPWLAAIFLGFSAATAGYFAREVSR